MPPSHNEGMEKATSQLTVAETFFGEELTSAQQVEKLFDKMSPSQFVDFFREYGRYVSEWNPVIDPTDATVLHIGKAHESIAYPDYWMTKNRSKPYPDHAFSILRKLLYIPKLSIYSAGVFSVVSPDKEDPWFYRQELCREISGTCAAEAVS
jgi:hypothetical protein